MRACRRTTIGARLRGIALLVALAGAAPVQAQAPVEPLAVCVAEDNPPLSYRVQGEDRGLDVRVAHAVAEELKRPLKIVPFESKYERESSLTHEVNALLSSGVCELASGFALLATDLGPPSRPTAKVPDHPGAKRRPLRPWVTLGSLSPSRPYHTMAMSLVVRDPSLQEATLSSLAAGTEAKIGVVSGTLAGTTLSIWRNGKLRPRLVSLAQNEDVLAELEAGRFDATLVPLDRLDAWRLAHPATVLRRAAYLHPLRINMGFVARTESTELLAAVDRVIERARAAGDLQRWSEQSGTTWIPPAEPAVTRAIGFADLLGD